MLLSEATSVYLAKLNQFLSDSTKEEQQFIKKALNNLFVGLGKDFNGYIEGKRPVIKDFGIYKIFKMQIQVNSEKSVKDTEPGGSHWKFYDLYNLYWKDLGQKIEKTIDGDRYELVYHKFIEKTDDMRQSEYEKATDLAKYPAVGFYRLGTRGHYKNIDKNIKGDTYSVVVSVPVRNAEDLKNDYMSKSGNVYSFGNGVKENDREYSISYDRSDGEFTVVQWEPDSYDRFTTIYGKSRNSEKAFKALVQKFDGNTTCAQAEGILKDNGINVKHSWWFNPYTD